MPTTDRKFARRAQKQESALMLGRFLALVKAFAAFEETTTRRMAAMEAEIRSLRLALAVRGEGE